MDEQTLKGNSGLLKCHFPSFVSDFVTVDAWIDEETSEEYHPDIGGSLGENLNCFIIAHFLDSLFVIN